LSRSRFGAIYYQLYRPDGALLEPEELLLEPAVLRGESVRGVRLVFHPRGLVGTGP
jgi:hypothetical protein